MAEKSKNEKKSQENEPTQADQVLETQEGAKTERNLIPEIKKEDDDDFAIKALDKKQPVPDQPEINAQLNLTSV